MLSELALGFETRNHWLQPAIGQVQVLADSHERGVLAAGAGDGPEYASGLPAMLVLSGLPTLTDNLARAKSYSERMFQAEQLDALNPPEDVLAFTRPFESFGRLVDAGVVGSVRRATGGYPFHIQFFGALLWEASAPLVGARPGPLRRPAERRRTRHQVRAGSSVDGARNPDR